MDLDCLKQILCERASLHKLSFIVGNGINRYVDESFLSWSSILIELSRKYLNENFDDMPNGISETEFFDMVSLFSGKSFYELKQEVKELLQRNIKDKDSGNFISMQNNFKKWDIPVLTTNFDNNLERGLSKSFFKRPERKFTAYYPWNVYWSPKNDSLNKPQGGFGIWHINGSIDYINSIRFGLTDYMNIVSYTRTYLHTLDESDNFSGKNQNYWKGYSTWLHIFMNCTLCIFGLSLDVNETYLRWLLIQRKLYFKKFPDREHEGYYISDKEVNPGKRLFLESVGLDVVICPDYNILYEDFLKKEN